MSMRSHKALLFFLAISSTSNVYHTTNALSWQSLLDKAILDIDVKLPQQRVRAFQKAVRDPDFPKDVTKAFQAIQTKGFGKGHPEAIDLLWPEGTIARKDLEGIQAFVKQVGERRLEFESLKDVSTLLEKTTESLQVKDPSLVLSTAFEEIRSNPEKSVSLLQNSLRSTPKDVEMLSYNVLRSLSINEAEEEVEEGSDDSVEETAEKKSNQIIAELRQYDAYKSISFPLEQKKDDESGFFTLQTMAAGLSKLSSYFILGNNDESKFMSMTSPFIISKSSTQATMTMKIPEMFAEAPPVPESDADLVIDSTPEFKMVVLEFSGICTDQEVERQVAKLMDIINQDETVEIASEEKMEMKVLQYNAPGTLPWRRRNEIGITVNEVVESDDSTFEMDMETEMETETNNEEDMYDNEGNTIEEDANDSNVEDENTIEESD